VASIGVRGSGVAVLLRLRCFTSQRGAELWKFYRGQGDPRVAGGEETMAGCSASSRGKAGAALGFEAALRGGLVGAEGTRGGLKRRPEILGVRDGKGVPEITAVITLAAGARAGEAGGGG